MTHVSARPRRDDVRSALVLALASFSSFAAPPPAFAQEAPSRVAADTILYDIPAQPLSAALVQFAAQSDLQILFAQQDVAGLISRPLQGRMRPADALAILLPSGAPRIAIVEDRIVATGRGASASDVTGADDVVLVTGTRIRGAAPVGSNILTLDRDAIDATGASTVQGAIATLPQNFPGVQNEMTQLGTNAFKNISFGTAIDLRGLGSDATLTLLNGRRMAPAGSGNFVDVSVVPLAAIDRIEVLADGASATYGADAVGGVVNIILRHDFAGAQSQLRLGGDTSGDLTEIGASHVFGASWPSGNVVVGYDYRERSHLQSSARDFSRTADLRRWGGQDFTRTMANPGNITRIGATPVSYAIPTGQDGTSLSQSDLLAGAFNRQEPNAGSYLLPEQTSHGVFASVRQELSDKIDVFADLLASRREAYGERAQVTTSLSVPQSNYYRQLNNLFPGQGNLSIAYFLGDDLGSPRYVTHTDALSSVIGIGYDAENGWRTEASFAYAALRDFLDLQNNYNTAGPLQAALVSNNIATAFNPFADGSNTPQSVLDGLVYDQTTQSDSNIASWSVKTDGPLFGLWGGPLRVAFGAEQRLERFDIERLELYPSGPISQFMQKPGERTTTAYFAEMLAPLLGPENDILLVHALSLSASLRHEQAEGVESSTTPRFGISWALSPDLALRGSWGKSFKAPQFQQTLGGIGGTLTTATAAQDPLADNGSTGVLILLGSNAQLRPERATTWTAGFDLTPRFLAPLRLQATYFDIDFRDRIATPGSVSAALRNSAGLESVFFRDPSPDLIARYLAIPDSTGGSVGPDGVEVIFDGRLTNLAALQVRGVDLSLDYHRETPLGALSLFASASGIFEHERQAAPAAQFINTLDTLFNVIEWRARFGGALQRGRWSLGLTGAYTDSYTDNLSLPNRRITPLVTWDGLFSYDLGAAGKGPRVSLSVQNMFDDEPPFANNAFGYGFDTSNFSPIGRFVALELRQRW